MKCSIVITTFDKPDSLDLVLTSIFRQAPPFEFEVIVVDDGMAKGTAEVCKKYWTKIKYMCTQNTEYRNPSKARNVGYREAKGEVLICQYDDKCM